jgi:hypothetical protein
MHRRPWLAAKVIGSFLVGLVGLIGSIYGIWGAPWPTEPVFAPGPPSFGSAFSVPFVVSNKSALFPINNLMITCHLRRVLTDKNNLVEDVGFGILSPNVLMPLQSRPYICPFDQFSISSGRIIAVEIDFESKYKSPWPFFSKPKTTMSDIFTWNPSTSPPAWFVGTPVD